MKKQLLSLVATAELALCAPAFAQKDDALLAAATAEQPAVVKTLERLVNIETGTGTADGMAAMSDLLEAELKALVEEHAAETGFDIAGQPFGGSGAGGYRRIQAVQRYLRSPGGGSLPDGGGTCAQAVPQTAWRPGRTLRWRRVCRNHAHHRQERSAGSCRAHL